MTTTTIEHTEIVTAQRPLEAGDRVRFVKDGVEGEGFGITDPSQPLASYIEPEAGLIGAEGVVTEEVYDNPYWGRLVMADFPEVEVYGLWIKQGNVQLLDQ